MAVAVRGGDVAGVIFHSDHGSEYTADQLPAAVPALGDHPVDGPRRLGPRQRRRRELQLDPRTRAAVHGAASPPKPKPAGPSPPGSTGSTTGSAATAASRCVPRSSSNGASPTPTLTTAGRRRRERRSRRYRDDLWGVRPDRSTVTAVNNGAPPSAARPLGGDAGPFRPRRRRPSRPPSTSATTAAPDTSASSAATTATGGADESARAALCPHCDEPVALADLLADQPPTR